MNSKQQDALLAAVQLLEENGGVKQPTTAKSLEGKWTLLYTTKQGTQSPIQVWDFFAGQQLPPNVQPSRSTLLPGQDFAVAKAYLILSHSCSSPLTTQNTFIGVDAFTVYQVSHLNHASGRNSAACPIT